MDPHPPDGDPALYTFDARSLEPVRNSPDQVTADAAHTSLIPVITDDTPPPAPSPEPSPASTDGNGLLPPIRVAENHRPPNPKRVTGTLDLTPETADPSQSSVLNRQPAPMPAFTSAPSAPPEPFVTAPMPRYDEPEPAPTPEPAPASAPPAPEPPEAASAPAPNDAADPLRSNIPPEHFADCARTIAAELDCVYHGRYRSFAEIRARADELYALADSMSPHASTQRGAQH